MELPRMSTTEKNALLKKRLVMVGAGLLLALGLVVGIKYLQQIQQQAMLAQPRPPATVASASVQQENWRQQLDAVGSLVASNGIAVTTEVAGIVSEILFESGQPVAAGEVLLHLDAAVDHAALDALRAERRLAEVRFNRANDLLKRQVMSRSEFDEARASYDAATARVEQQQAIINRKTIRAPFAGQLGIRQINLGQYLEPGLPVVKLQALDPIYADYSLPERYLPQVALGQQVEVLVNAFPQQRFTGELSAIDAGIDAASRSLRLRATLANPDGQLQPGMFAEVSTLGPEIRPVLTVPHTAISFNPYGDFVFVISKNADGQHMVQRSQVRSGEVRDGRIAILDGLDAGDEVVRAGLIKLRDSMPVQIDNSVELDDAEVGSK